ncbi:hypothetical protein [Bradyrhizobium sp. CB2312]|uniref:hypothetical protein n=1 Tax=Bradyrhizobium sp. CB2312 TaxID=3039155 RepID=UPI0024B0D62F|nr:hypothetical protein [Bradyrhizobium sp. CB2312]WFU75403.1 hypothetical protein QA642_15920 [Bradyrhizobium sp. CB2312]
MTVNLEQDRVLLSEPTEQDDGLDAAVEQAIAVCSGNMRAAIRALIVANKRFRRARASSPPRAM